MTGNTIVVKPSERDPGACLILGELAREAGFPPGVINIIHGSHPTVNALLDSPIIKAISFVGSNSAGEYIYQRAAETGKRCQANLGAKNHAIVMPDCDVEHAINGVVGAAFGAAGQRCMALSAVVFVDGGKEKRSKKFLGKLKERAEELVVNGGFEEGTDVGPMISPESVQKVEGLVERAVKPWRIGDDEGGAKLVLDGRGYKPEMYPNGNWVRNKFLLITYSHCHFPSKSIVTEIFNSNNELTARSKKHSLRPQSFPCPVVQQLLSTKATLSKILPIRQSSSPLFSAT